MILFFYTLYRFPVIFWENRIAGIQPGKIGLIILCFLGILKDAYILSFLLRFRVAHQRRPEISRRLSRSAFSPSVTRKFQKNFRKISPLFPRPCNRFSDEKFDTRGGSNFARIFFRKFKKFFNFMQIFCSNFPSNHPANRSNPFRIGSPSPPDTLPAPSAYVC